MSESSDAAVKSCLDCGSDACCGGGGELPGFCPLRGRAAAVCAAEEAGCGIIPDAEDGPALPCFDEYAPMTRVEETMAFARSIGAKKLGVATCAGLLGESRTLARILRANGFEVYGVCCKVGSLSKLDTGLKPKELAQFKNGPIMCNPIGQAMLLNRAGTDLNILMGLCVGHDSIFYRFCDGLCTALVAKDRVLAHNSAGALYETGSFYRKLLK